MPGRPCDTTIRIALACDQNFVRHAGAAIASAVANSATPEDISFFLVSDGVTAGDITRLANIAQRRGSSFAAAEVPAWYGDLPGVGSFPRSTFARLSVAELLPDLDRILFLDCDTLVLADLSELWRSDLKEQIAAAMPEPFSSAWYRSRLGMPDRAPYFNAGVMLISLDRWREGDVTGLTLDAMKSLGAKAVCADQDGLNVVLHGQWVPMHPRYNATTQVFTTRIPRWHPGYAAYRQARRSPAIVHFTNAKPWGPHCIHPLRRQYFSFASMTPWDPADLRRPRLLQRCAAWYRHYRGAMASRPALSDVGDLDFSALVPRI